MPEDNDRQPSLLRVLIVLGILSLLGLGILWATLGRMAAEKTATLLALPCGIIWYLLTGCVIVACSVRQRKLALAIAFVWLAYTVCGSGRFASLVVRNVESPFSTVDPLKEEPFDAVIVLGGGGSIGSNERFQGNGSGDRIILAAQLYHTGLTQKLICTGKQIVSVDGEGFGPAKVSMELLTGLGVPESAIEQLGGHNTSEEMQTLGKRFSAAEFRVGLVTSAWHLPRAIGLANSNGFDPVPLPADFMAGPNKPQTTAQFIMSFLPQADNFVAVARITREHLGRLVGR